MPDGTECDAGTREGHLAKTFDRISLALVLLSVAAVLSEPLRIHHDPANLITASSRWVDGHARLDEMAGMNLPLALYLYSLPALVSSSLGLPPIPVLSSFTLGLLLLSAAACRRLLGEGAPGPATSRAFFGAVLAGFVLFSIEGPELTFGQREVFFLALVLPFVLVRWRRGEGSPSGALEACLSGVAAALGALLKPQLLLVLLAAEMALRFSGCRPRLVRTPESLAFGATALGYALHFFLLPGAVLGAFGAAASGAAAGYRAYNASLSDLLLHLSHLPLVLVSVAALTASRKGPADAFVRLSAALSGLGLGGLAVFFLQRKGFPYHLVPAVAGAVLSASALAGSCAVAGLRADLCRRLRRLGRPLTRAAAVAPVGAAMLVILAASRLPDSLEVAPRTTFEEMLGSLTSRGEEVLVISTSVYPSYPALLRMDRRPYGRWMGPFMGIAFARAGDPREGVPRYPGRAEMGAEERGVLDALERDLQAAPPRVVLIAARPPHQGLPRSFDLLEYLRVAGFLEGALQAFDRGPDVAGFAVYRLRAPRAAPIEEATHSSAGGVSPG